MPLLSLDDCPRCGHRSHTGDSCTAGIFALDGQPAVCPCIDERD